MDEANVETHGIALDRDSLDTGLGRAIMKYGWVLLAIFVNLSLQVILYDRMYLFSHDGKAERMLS